MTIKGFSDSHFDLTWISDAVHGPIDIKDVHGLAGERRLVTLMNSRPLDRLRRVRQVFFAPQSYLSADHSRYAHSVGTMHVMRLLLSRLNSQGSIPAALYQDLHLHFPETFEQPDESGFGILVQHMLTAALLLDTGELPFSQATRHVFAPDSTLRESVAQEMDVPAAEIPSKQVFTVGCLIDRSNSDLIEGYSVPFLIYLLTGAGVSPLPQDNSLRMLRHMLDGAVDADRLDYVYRDAHHTSGALGTPASIVETLESYDAHGPIFDDPGPVSLFLAMRAHLYSTVYLAPAIRFRTILLVHLLQGIARSDRCAAEFFGSRGSGDLSIDDFLEFDDVSLTSKITDFAQTNLARSLDNKSRLALEMFLGTPVPYESSWLPPGSNESEANLNLTLPDELFYDTFSDQARLLYQPSSVRIRSERFRHFGLPAPLEECGGSFASLFREPWSMLPMPQSTQLYTPKQRRGRSWRGFDKALAAGWLPFTLLAQDPLSGLDVPSDTRNSKSFSGPSLFISFTWADVTVLKRVVRALYRRRVRYYVLLDPFQGVGGAPGDNSITAARDAERALILASSEYINRYRDAPDGNIAKEVFELSRRVQSGEIRIGFLSVDPFRQVKDGLPWSQFGYTEAPFLGEPLQHANDHTVSEAMDALLEHLK